MFNKISIQALFVSTVLSIPLFASFTPPPGYNESGRSGTSMEQNKDSLIYPRDTTAEISQMPPKLQQNHFEINIDEDEVNYIQKRAKRFKKLMDGTYGVGIIQEVDHRAFKAIDNIDLLTNHTTVITFPSKYKIKKAISSVDLKENRISQNVLFVQAKKDFTEGDIVVSLTNGKQNIIVELILNKFLKSGNKKGSIFHPFVKYVEIPHISNYKLLKIYFKLYGESRIKYFLKNGKFDVIEYKKVPFYIIRDDKFGNIEYRGVNFRISNSL